MYYWPEYGGMFSGPAAGAALKKTVEKTTPKKKDNAADEDFTCVSPPAQVMNAT
ncbi:unnamed protein product [Polarella glacialis]|nr:unnamed protein product [Polarella glacialis]CAE8721740.1 unnamed protein product [Polarella glacialis]